jgi:hypothetical protein
MATERDLYCIAWIADQYAARFDQVQRLLSRFPDQEHPFKDKLIGEKTTKDMIARWQRAGWIEYQRVLASGRGFAWVTRAGLQLVGLDEIYTAREPSPTRLAHIYGVNQVRLWMDSQGYEWTSERRYRVVSGAGKKGKLGENTGPIPDAVISHEKTGVVAIEVELSPKKPADLAEKLSRLVRAPSSPGAQAAFPVAWFYVPSENAKALIEAASQGLPERERRRVSVAVQKDLIG